MFWLLALVRFVVEWLRERTGWLVRPATASPRLAIARGLLSAPRLWFEPVGRMSDDGGMNVGRVFMVCVGPLGRSLGLVPLCLSERSLAWSNRGVSSAGPRLAELHPSYTLGCDLYAV
jgi:hypothetical protein